MDLLHGLWEAALSTVAPHNRWVLRVFVIVLVTATVAHLTARLLDRLERRLQQTHTLWDDAFFEAVRAPVRVLVWLVGLTSATELALRQGEAPGLQVLMPAREIGVVLLLAWFMVRFVRQAEQHIADPAHVRGDPLDPTTAAAIGRLVRISVLITAALVVLQTLGFSIASVLAFGGIGGLAVGFAAKDLLANFFGGLMVYMDRPFCVGDWVRSPDKDIEGTVEEIGWRLTRIRTFDQRPLYVPNATFTSIAVENPSRMHNRRIYETIGLRYDDNQKLAGILESVRQYLHSHPEIDVDKTLMVNFNHYGASSLDFFIYAFTRTTVWAKYHAIKEQVLLDVLEIIHTAGADIAYPTTRVHLEAPSAGEVKGGAP